MKTKSAFVCSEPRTALVASLEAFILYELSTLILTSSLLRLHLLILLLERPLSINNKNTFLFLAKELCKLPSPQSFRFV